MGQSNLQLDASSFFMSCSRQPLGLFDLPEQVLGQIISTSKGVRHYRTHHPLLRVCRQ
jgi:hypothetical protein